MTTQPEPTPRTARRHRGWQIAGGVVLLLTVATVATVLLWDWNWLRPYVERQASAALGREVRIERLSVKPGRLTTIVAEGLRVANPAGYDGPDTATATAVTLDFEVETWWRQGRIVLPRVVVDRPTLRLTQTAPDRDNWHFPVLSGESSGPALEIGDLVVNEGIGHIQAVDPVIDTDLKISTGQSGGQPTLVMEAKGTYNRLPIVALFTGGALLSVRETGKPYPVDFTLNNGPTHIVLKGTVSDPLSLGGANLSLTLSGPNMELLYPLTGIATPKTPPYTIAGKLDFVDKRIRFTGIAGRIGSSDIGGAIEIAPGKDRPLLTGFLSSKRVDMEDLGGFIGSEPGRTTTPGQTAAQIADVKRAEASPKLLPTRTISIPKLLAMDVHLKYHGAKIVAKNSPLESISATMNIDAGHIRLEPLQFGISGGTMTGYLDLEPVGEELALDVSVAMAHVNLGGILGTVGMGSGTGPIDGVARLKGRGASTAAIVGKGEGDLKIVMPKGGQVNALLIDLSGFEAGPALLAALNIPAKEAVRCMVADFELHQGIMVSRNLVIDTTDHILSGGGRIDLNNELVDMHIRTDVKHFTIGKLGTPISVSGPFKDLSYQPGAELALRGAAAIGLGLLFPPAAILPTIHFGVGEGSPCARPK
jgi:uncharacterized protein involved in outer membrane biogenesis